MADDKKGKNDDKDRDKEKKEEKKGPPPVPQVKRLEIRPFALGKKLGTWAILLAIVAVVAGLTIAKVHDNRNKDKVEVVQYLGVQPDSARVKIVTTIPMEVSVKDSVWWAVPFDFKKGKSYIVTVTGNAYQRAAWTNGLALRNKADELVSPAGAPWNVKDIPHDRAKLYLVRNAPPACLIGAVGELVYRDSDGFPIIKDAKYFPIGVKRVFRIAGGQKLHLGMNEPLDWSVKIDNGGIWKFSITVQRE